MTDLFEEAADATPLTPAERQGLKPDWIVTRSDLNEAEQDNIAKGAAWARRRKAVTADALLNDTFVMELHKRILGDVWSWAGNYRDTKRNLGIEPYNIPPAVRTLLDDVRHQIAQKSYSRDEIAVRFHHRLVAIHPFPNGNGRHSRLIADLLIEQLGGAPFTWGSGDLADKGTLRARYIQALQAADNDDVAPLLAFARA